MGEVLYELEQVLRSKQVTSQEANVLMACKAQAIRGFTVGAGAAGGVVWLATRRLSNILRINLVGGIAVFSGLYRFGKALDSCVEHILNQQGSRMQQELANIMARRYWDNQSMMQRISKHFYPENVFDDSSVDQPKLRWRYRNIFNDGVPRYENTQGNDSIEKTDVKPEPIYVSSDDNATTDPLDLVFGNSSSVDEVNRTASSTTVPRRQSRTHKKSKRRQRIQKREASLYSQHTLVEDS